MAGFSLFRPNTVEAKFSKMQSLKEAEGLIAAMFTFSARFRDSSSSSTRPADCPEPSYFAHIALAQLNRALEERGERIAPLWLIQTSILVTFHQLTQSVRSKSWRTLGACIRLAYDLKLHLIDANYREPPKDRSNIDIDRWSRLEERRRAWWAIWEMDVFASTIRRLPTGIDWEQNMTFLPVDDRYWFGNIYQDSCMLHHDYTLRWKHLAASGNKNPRAWFIVLNSLMRNTQLTVYSAGLTQARGSRQTTPIQAELTIMTNCLSCTVASLPHELAYGGETLDFRTKRNSHDINDHQYHGDKFAIHLMTQLARFLIEHHKLRAQAPWIRTDISEETINQGTSASTAAWLNYMNAADEIANIVRHSSRDHYKYVNPFLVNSIWFAAAAQCACKVFGPASFDKRLADSNFDLLSLEVEQFVSFWGSADSLRASLTKMEAGLKNLMSRENGLPKEQGPVHDNVQQPLQDTAASQRGEVDGLVLQDPTIQTSSTQPDPGLSSALGGGMGGDSSAIAFIGDPFELTQSAWTADFDPLSDSIEFPDGFDDIFALGQI